MKRLVLLFSIGFLFFLPFSSIAQQEYKCSEWKEYSNNDIQSKLFLKICESSNSGFLQIKNSTEKEVKLTYTVNFNNGETTTGTVIVDLDDKSPKLVCSNCMDSIGGGIKSWEFKDIIFNESN